MKSTSGYSLGAEFNGADQVSNSIFKTEITPKVSFANMTFVAKLFSNYKLGRNPLRSARSSSGRAKKDASRSARTSPSANATLRET